MMDLPSLATSKESSSTITLSCDKSIAIIGLMMEDSVFIVPDIVTSVVKKFVLSIRFLSAMELYKVKFIITLYHKRTLMITEYNAFIVYESLNLKVNEVLLFLIKKTWVSDPPESALNNLPVTDDI